MNFDIQAVANAIERHNRIRVEEQYCLGSVWGIFTREGALYSGGLGHADLARTRALNERSIFRMASMTKPIVGVAAMQLVEQGKLELDAPVADRIPAFADMEVAEDVQDGVITRRAPAKTPITLRTLLSHSSGLGCGRTYESQSRACPKKDTLKETMTSYGGSVLNFHPGLGQVYSPIMGMDVTARLIELASGQSLAQYLQTHIFDPLGMVDTTFLPTDAQCSRVVEFVTGTPDGLQTYPISGKVGFWGFQEGWVSGSAGLFSTLADYSRFARMLLGDGTLAGVQILKPETVELMAQPQLPMTIPGITEYFNWGLSVRVCPAQSDKQPLTPGSFGWSGSFGTHFWVDRAKGIAGIYMMNISNALGSAEPAAKEFERDVMLGLS